MGWINLLQNNTQWPARFENSKEILSYKNRRETVQEIKGILGITSGGVLGYVELVQL
jgi:hypothetical protein